MKKKEYAEQDHIQTLNANEVTLNAIEKSSLLQEKCIF
jgi:hypothetical protein